MNTLRNRIRQAYHKAAGNRWNARALMSDVRKQLPDVPRNELDQEIKMMQRQQQCIVYHMDNHRDITPEIDAAAISVGGEKRHILWIER